MKTPFGKNGKASGSLSPTKAAVSKPVVNKFGKAFNTVGEVAFAASPKKVKVTMVEVNYEVLTPLRSCLVTFSNLGNGRSSYTFPLVANLDANHDDVYKKLRFYMTAVLYGAGTSNGKLKKPDNPGIDDIGIILNFNGKEDIQEGNILKNVVTLVNRLVGYANKIADKDWNDDNTQTFQFKNHFVRGTDFTRTNPRRNLGQVICPEDSLSYMKAIFENLTFEQIVYDEDIMTDMYGSVEMGNKMVKIARRDFVPHAERNGDAPVHNNREEEESAFVAEP
jgi:hypothetical protein